MSIREVLVVDHDPNSRVLLRRILEGAGMLVTDAETIDQAVEIAVKTVPHLIIADLQLPGKTALDLLDLRRSLPAIVSTPIIVMTGYKQQDDLHGAMSFGAQDGITKPFQTTLVLKKVKKALQDREFLTLKFEENELKKIHITFPAQVSQINEVGCLVESSIGISPETHVELKAELLKSFEIQDIVMKTAAKVAQLSPERAFVNHVVFIGITEQPAKRIRKAVRDWH